MHRYFVAVINFTLLLEPIKVWISLIESFEVTPERWRHTFDNTRKFTTYLQSNY